MFKFIYLTTSFVLFIIILHIVPCTSFTCVHDRIPSPKSGLSLTRSIKYQDIREEHDKDPSLFEPLKVHFYIDTHDSPVSANTIHNIELAFKKVKDKLEKVFQVRKRKRPFVLERMGCTQRWQAGENRGKCSAFKSEEETCLATEIEYLIPERYLNKLEVYDFEGDKPRYSTPAGPGLLESNFIAFITSQDSVLCEEQDVAAYGTYCRSDSKTNEPLAGIINLCVSYFARKVYPPYHYYSIILHEMLHVLGFSFSLFEKFLPCEKGVYCDMPKNVIQQDSNGTYRMMFPLVIEQMQKHFSCSKPDFGGPMFIETELHNASDFYTSHWHPVLMYTSVMSPLFSEFEEVVVDNITLAVFGSTGWYRVNYSNADVFRFGKGEGCGFGISSSCEDNVFLCDPNHNTTGCDMLHKTIGRCTSLTSQHPCGTFQAYSTEHCESATNKQYQFDLYSYGYQKKCFMLSSPDVHMWPICLPVRCKTEDIYEVMINMTWYPCHFNEPIETSNLTAYCPDSFLFCSDVPPPALHRFCPAEENFFVAVRIHFMSPTFDQLSKFKSFKNFKVTTLRAIAKSIGIPVNYIVNASLTLFKTVSLDFAICPSPSLTSDELNVILNQVQKFLDDGVFKHILKGQEDLIISSTEVIIDSVDAIKFSDHEGFRALLIFPVFCAIFIIATFVASLLRLFLTERSQRVGTSSSTELSDVRTPS